MPQLKLNGKPIPDDAILNSHPPNVICIFGDWGYEENPVTEEDEYVTNIEELVTRYCEYAEFVEERNRCQGGCDSDSKGGGIGYCLKINTKMSILGQPWSVRFE